MINVSLITEQLAQHFAESPVLGAYHISRSEPVNTNPEAVGEGWVGIYKDTISYDPTTLSQARRRYYGGIQIRFLIQRVSRHSGEEAEEFLEQSVLDVIEAIIGSDDVAGIKTRTPNYIKNFEGFEVEYGYIETDKATFYHQQAVVTMSAEIDTNTA